MWWCNVSGNSKLTIKINIIGSWCCDINNIQLECMELLFNKMFVLYQ